MGLPVRSPPFEKTTYQSVLELGILVGPSKPLVPQLRSAIEVDRGNDLHIT